MYVSKALKAAALTVRNLGRQNAERNAAHARRVDRARAMFKKPDAPQVKMFGSIAFVDVPASKGNDKHLVTLYEDDRGCRCTCPDSARGNLCKHRLFLAAAVIARAAEDGVTA